MSVRIAPASRGAAVVNRLVLLVLGAALVAVGLGAWEWRYAWLSEHPQRADVGQVVDLVAETWFAWVAGVVGLALVLIALWWLFANATPPTARKVRLRDSDARGTLAVDLASVGSAVAPRWEQTAPVAHAKASTRTLGGRQVLELRADLDPRADEGTVKGVVRGLAEDLHTAFPGGEIRCRVLLGGTRTRLLRRTTHTRVQ